MWFLRLTALLALGMSGCNSCEPGAVPKGTPSAGASADATPGRSEVRSVQFSASDGVVLAGELRAALEPSAPAVVLIHRATSDRSEWQPLVERLGRASKRYAILSFDLRGHGRSAAGPADGSAGADAPEGFVRDVNAAVECVLKETGAPSVVLVGSSLGATLAARVAFAQPKVSALALISPGAAIQGVDVYRPYAEVRNLPTFVAAAEADTVSKDPLRTLAKMAMAGTSKTYAGEVHGAGFLGERHAEFWQDLEAWLMSVHQETPRERRSLYYAEGLKPDAAPKRPEQRAQSTHALSGTRSSAGKQE
ncbi:MAG TPA: alpha/beta fold hydrolase [Polyangiaceae bacterium]|nr:alpha/beta fold hydrolase [Polyangiaceae bacterium]